MKIIAALLMYILLASAQSKPQPVETTGPCSPITTGNNNTFNITCGIGKQQGDALLKIMNKVLVNQLDPDVVMKKLDEILKAVNPNIPAKTYSCNGQWRTVGPSAIAALNVGMGGDDKVFQDMVRMNNGGQYPDLLKACLAQIESTPEWLTPRLLCGLAYLGAGDRERAAAMLREFDSRTGPAYDADGCKQMSDYLHSQLR